MTSSSSGHSDDRLFELIPENLDYEMSMPPPLPTKHNSVSRLNNSNSKRQNVYVQLPQPHYQPNVQQHSRVQVSHSLPLQHASYSSPLSTAMQNNIYDQDVKYKLLEKNEILKQESEKNRQIRQEVEYVVTKAPKVS